MERYIVSRHARPWFVIFQSTSLDALAEALAAQPRPRDASLYVNCDGRARELDPTERITLFDKLLQLIPDDEEATIELAEARRDARQQRAP